MSSAAASDGQGDRMLRTVIPSGSTALKINLTLLWKQGWPIAGKTHRIADLKVVELLRRHPDGLSPKQVGDGLGISDARQVLHRLAEQGRIVKTQRGCYIAPVPPVTSVTSVTFDGFDPS